MIHNYTIEAYNLDKNKWDIYDYARTMEEAISKAQKAIGYSKAHADIEILDAQGLVIWESEKQKEKV
jgi:predicted RNA-binding protein Jag